MNCYILTLFCNVHATTSIQCITWIQYIFQREIIHVTPDLYAGFTNLIPLTIPHDGLHVTTCIYTFHPFFRFTIQVTHDLVEHCVEGLLVVTRGETVVHVAKDDVQTHDMRMPTPCIEVHITPRPGVLVSDTSELFAVCDPSHRHV